MLAIVHFQFCDLMDVREVARGFPMQVHYSDMAFLMPCLEEAANVIIAIAPLEAILHGPSLDHEG